MESTTQTLSQIKSQEFAGHIQKHFIIASHLTHVTNGVQDFVKCCIKRWVHLHLRPDKMLFGGLQPSDINHRLLDFKHLTCICLFVLVGLEKTRYMFVICSNGSYTHFRTDRITHTRGLVGSWDHIRKYDHWSVA